ncbi:class II aldolase/adducin family protein [Nocardioides sp.]|jgi:ribulose-5-phosphate 4-epimerase/fuculose-1-phosphate aldolase|uniref:class II aldolase/adducin family protein n=1 Tax=Nocardioides sp. TaxID=35761 RepID=UPI00262FC433|nr:class II aldolase/adducin family protein [Nocardioides sp.]
MQLSAVDPTEAEPRKGGLEVWAPSVMPPVIRGQLTDEQTLALSFRVLAHEGFSENMAGHITWQRPGQTEMLVNPWGLWWDEVSASDMCVVDEDARVVSGHWDVTPAIHIHTELHRRRADARVVVHNHPYYVCVLAALGRLPELVHQTGSMYLDDMVMVEEYDGEIDTPLLAQELAERIGDAKVAVLANHGVIVTGANPIEATYRAASFERACKLAYDVLVSGHEPLKLRRSAMIGMKASLLERAAEVYWGGAVRRLLRTEPEVLG